MKLDGKRFLFNSHSLSSAAGRVCMVDLPQKLKERGCDVTINDWSNYKKYDYIFFMSPDAAVVEAKNQNTVACVGIMDPKIRNTKAQLAQLQAADFFLVSSTEQREFFLTLKKNIEIYYMFPKTSALRREHTEKKKIILGYHGNKLHLHNFRPHLTDALINLSARYEIELKAVYNIEKLGMWKSELEKHIPIQHIQWSEQSLSEAFKDCDIGLSPNLVHQDRSTSSLFSSIRHALKQCPYHCYPHDYVNRYKYSTNPGRLYVFSQLGIPVVSDFTPSSAHFLQDGMNGLVVHGSKGWEYAIEKLIRSPELRQTYADNLRGYIAKHYSIEQNIDRLLTFLASLPTPRV